MRRIVRTPGLNLIILLATITVSAVWQQGKVATSSDTSTHSIDGRYHWASIGRDVLIEIKDGKYTETQQMGNTTIREVVSRGYCFQVDESILLSERETDVPRRLELTRQGFRETSTSREFEICVHPSSLICRGENPFSVDGVRLGMTRAEVEARWGGLYKVHCGWRVFQSRTADNMAVSLDSSGRVTSVSGRSLYEFSRPVSYNELNTYGHPDPNFGYAPPLHNKRVVGDYHIFFVGKTRKRTISSSSYCPDMIRS